MTMTKRTIFLSLLAFLLLATSTVYAQQPVPQNQCNDGINNDGQEGIDRWGVPSTGAGPDPQCIASNAVCENGSTQYPECPNPAPLLPVPPSSGTSTGSTAQPGGSTPNTTTQTGGTSTNAGTFNLSVKLKNPLGVSTIQGAISKFMSAVVKIAIPFIVVFFIWSGLNFILARGNEKKLTDAKRMFWYTVIGTLLILGAWAITDAIVGTVNSIAS